MYGHPFLLENLPPTDSAPLADYLPYLNLLKELLKKHTDQILPHPITISVKPGDLVLLKDLLPSPLGLRWTIWSFSRHPLLSSSMGSPSGGTSQGTVRKMEKGIGRPLKLSREQHFTVVLLANTHPNAYVSCSPIFKFPPLYHNQL
jgi:hypothetical protein